MILKIQNIVKLKLLKIYFLFLLKQFFYINQFFCCLNFVNYFFFLNNFYKKISKNNFLNNNINKNSNINYFYLLKSKLNFFKNDYLNSFILYNIFNNSFKKFNTFLTINNISNYNSKYLFLYYYYFVKNTKLGVNKYFVNFYQNNLFFIKFFVFKFIKLFINNNLYLSFQKNNLIIFEKAMIYNFLIKKTKYLKFLKEIDFKIKSFLNLLLIGLYSKDVVLLKNGIKNILERLHFKKHRKFLHNLKLLLKSLSSIFFFKFKCLGLYIKIKGKIGLGGSSKKKKFVFKLGSFSFTKKSQKINYVKDCIRTYSGVLGFELYLTYK